MGSCLLVFCSAVLAVGKFRMGLGIGPLRALAFIALAFGGEATLYATRERRRIWSSWPSVWVVAATLCDIAIASLLVLLGIAMAPLPILVVGETFAAAVSFAFILDFVKVPVLRRLRVA
jgi:H+-transporting ATPase